MLKYILQNHEAVAVNDVVLWAQWMEQGIRRVALFEQGDIRVSTVFLGLDHSFGMAPEPILFETMVFWPDNEELDQSQWRYSTWDESLIGHNEAVAQVMLAMSATS